MTERIEPTTVDDAAHQLAAAWDAGHPTVVSDGSGEIGSPPAPAHRVSFRSLTRIVDVATADGAMVVEAGVPIRQIRDAAAAVGLWCPALRWLDPTGLIGTAVAGGHGRRSRRYGAVADYVQGMRFACPAVGLVRHGGLAIKNATGYNLTAMVAGSRGELGVILEVILRLVPLPRERATAFYQLPRAPASWLAIQDLTQLGDDAPAQGSTPVDAVEAFEPIGSAPMLAHIGSAPILALVELEDGSRGALDRRLADVQRWADRAGGQAEQLTTWPPTEPLPLESTLRSAVEPRLLPEVVQRISAEVGLLNLDGFLLTEATGGSVEIHLSSVAASTRAELRAMLGPPPRAGVDHLRATFKSAFDPHGLLQSSHI